ncbi:exported hypothetical protein [Candidatus Sulfopaludibacter sp. SbA4]|nr:exported hypothetical protein [Candidatus Sulfopaludibacter sp. SbA4]
MRLLIFSLIFSAHLHAQFTQQGPELSGADAAISLIDNKAGYQVAISSDGNTAILGLASDNNFAGAAFVFTRHNGVWTQQGSKLIGNSAVGLAEQGYSVAISGDGNTAVVGGKGDNNFTGAAWIFTRSSSGMWSQQGPKLVGTPAASGLNVGTEQGSSVGISADGNTVIVGGNSGNAPATAWIFTRNGSGVWSQQGNSFAGTGAAPGYEQTDSGGFAISADGNTAVIGGLATDNGNTGAAWVFTRNSSGVWSQQGGKLVGAGAVGTAYQGGAVAISGDGNTIIVGGNADNNYTGAAWIFTRSSSGVWSQQGGKLTANDAVGAAQEGWSVSLSADGNTAIISGINDNNSTGAAWIFTRSGGAWSQQCKKLVGTPANGELAFKQEGGSVAMSGDGYTAIVGSGVISGGTSSIFPGAWIFAAPPPPTVPAQVSVSPSAGSGSTQQFTFTFSDTGGWQRLQVVDVLINNVLDGRQACYIAFVPSGASSGSVDLVDDSGDAGGPYSGMVLPGSGSVSNSQCSIAGAGSSAAGNGNTLTLTLAITFEPAFGGNHVMYLSAQDASANSGWQALGTWNAPGAAVSGLGVGLVSPGRGSGLTGTYTFTFTDTKGWQDIAVANVLINGSIDGRHACYLALVPISASSVSVLLVDDTGDAGGPYSGMVAPGAGSVSNGQCSIAGTGSSVAASGGTLTITLPITFSAGFAGNQVFYLAARSGTLNTGWQAVGSAAVH